VLSQAIADGSLRRVDRIAGEWHDGRVGDLVKMLSPLFDVETTVISDSTGLFFATRR